MMTQIAHLIEKLMAQDTIGKHLEKTSSFFSKSEKILLLHKKNNTSLKTNQKYPNRTLFSMQNYINRIQEKLRKMSSLTYSFHQEC